MTDTAVTFAAVGVSIVMVGALAAAVVLGVRMRLAVVKVDVEHVTTLSGWGVLAVSAAAATVRLWGLVFS